MVNSWEELENRCYEYLKKLYPKTPSIEAYGKSDSTKADIKVEVSASDEFYIEVKAASSQCCQFVIFPNSNTKQFDFSSSNKVPCFDNCKNIISYMNGFYKKYHRVGKKGIPIDVDKSTLYGLVQDFYYLKKVKFFMTEKNDFIIFPSDSFSRYFDINCFYRKKTSGSSEPNEENNNTEIIEGLKNNDIPGTIEYHPVGEKIRCFLHTIQDINKSRMVCTNYTYQFKQNKYSQIIAKKSSNVYEVRRLSNTSNPNVICQLSLKQDFQDKHDLENFKKIMRKK